MTREENIIIFYGPKKPFQKYIEDNSQISSDDFTLTQLVNLSEKERNKFTIEGVKTDNSKEQVSINNLIINAEEYSGVTEAVVNNFVSYISKYEIKKMFIQNPPQEIVEQLYRQFDKNRIREFRYEYEIINEEKIKKFKTIVRNKIIGQDEAIDGICRSLIIQSKLNSNKKPIVVMLYGPSGVGKTETARCIAEALGESMFYKQFSMFQNHGFREYLYGISYRESCFAKDLLNRNSNVIFLDEFDKANIFVYSGLYQMFDEGIFRDNNYEVNLENSLIICTSNYSNLQDIMNQLGTPMFYRINCFVEYKKLSVDTILKLIDKSFNNSLENIDKEIVDKVEQIKLREFIKSKSKLFNNARQIDNIIKEKIAEVILNMEDDKMSMYILANKYFNEFIKNNFDINDEKVSHKLKHTYQVVNNSKYICQKLNLDELNTDIAMIIALLHDIGRFTQAKEMQTFREDITNYDHATLGVKLLFDKNEIRKFISNNEYDKIIKSAIANHSKYVLDETGLSDNELLHCKIIRDADKIDSFRAKTVDDIYTMANIQPKDIEKSPITEKIYDDFMNEKTILSKDRKTGIDIWISYIAFIFGLEFKCSYELIKEKDYINKLFDRFEYELENKKMNELRIKALNYLDKKIC